MADSEEMRRLILHAADRLAEEDPAPTFEELLRQMSGHSEAVQRQTQVRRLRSLTAAMVLAESTLRMVAACMGVEEPPGRDAERDARLSEVVAEGIARELEEAGSFVGADIARAAGKRLGRPNGSEASADAH